LKRSGSISIRRLHGWARDVIKVHEVKIKFLIVGIWNTVFGYAVFVGLDLLFTQFFEKRYAAYMLAAVLSNILAIFNAYIFHKFITFRSPVRGLAIIPEFLRFFSMYLFSFFLGLVIPITTIICYLGHSRFSFNFPKGSVIKAK
jgi:putative flippase GtrA